MSYMKMGSIDLLFDYIACFTSPDRLHTGAGTWLFIDTLIPGSHSFTHQEQPTTTHPPPYAREMR
jgi:hypothetical protein